MPDIFLSYSRDDQAVAKRFAEAFERAGLSVWWDATLNPGEAYDKVTEKALEEARAVVVLWSRKSVDSRWVRAEATQANAAGTLVPVMIEPCKRPIMFELTHTADLSRWNGDPQDRDWLAYLAGVRRFINRPEPAVSSAAPAPAGAGRAQRGLRPAMIVATVLGLLLVAGGIQWLRARGGGEGAAPPAAAESSSEVSLAVLPFVNLSSDPEQEYFSDGLSEELLNELAQVRKLRLTARTSSFSFKGKNEDVRVIGQKLGVGNVLEGSVRKDGRSLRITAQLIDTRDGSHLWSKTYDRELEGIFAVQEEIARDVAQALSIRLDVGDMTRAEGGTNVVEAYDKYLQAGALYQQGLSRGTLLQAAQLYREALALDPNFSRATYGLYRVLVVLVAGVPEESAAAAREVPQVVARLEAQAPDAWWTKRMRAERFIGQRHWTEAQRELEALQTLADADNGSTIYLGLILGQLGRVGEAVKETERIRQADPLSLSVSVDLQRLLDLAGRDADAQAEYLRSRGLDGDHSESHHHALFRLWRMPGTTPAQIKAQFDLILAHESLPMALTRTLARDPGNATAARAAIRGAFDAPEKQDQLRMFVIALYAAHYGDRDLALDALHRRFIEMKSNTVYQIWHPYEGKLRTDPRFKQLLRDLGLADFFRSSGHWPDYCKPVGTDDFECH